ncbi:hypothetical protein [Caldiplasma sukawensis]
MNLNGNEISLKVKVGLMERFHQTGDWGFYIYCNNRLIISAAKSPELGFNEAEFHFPHARYARFRCEIFLNGPSYLMPWNSTKSGLNYDNPVIKYILGYIKEISFNYLKFSSKLASSRGFGSQQPISRNIGHINETNVKNIETIAKEYQNIKIKSSSGSMNTRKEKLTPWKQGIIDAIKIAEILIQRKKPEHKNRIILIILDSTIEIAFKDYLFYVIKDNTKNSDFESLMKNVQNRSKNQGISDTTWITVNNLHRNRNKLYHEHLDLTVTDQSIVTFKAAVIEIVEKLLSVNI